MSHIFISYSKQDITFVRYLRTLLESQGFAVWVDEKRLSPGTSWWKAIENNIEACAALVVVMSPPGSESVWVERELLLAENLKRPIFPVLLAGDPWSRLANIQYEDMREGLLAEPSQRFINSLRRVIPTQLSENSVALTVEKGDITRYDADVVIVKYAQNFYGADRVIMQRLVQQNSVQNKDLKIAANDFRLIASDGVIGAPHVLYVGTCGLRYFEYIHLREFVARGLQVLGEELPDTAHVAMTIHGPGFGMDEQEALRSQIAGYQDALVSGELPAALQKISIVEISAHRANRLRETMDQDFAEVDTVQALGGGQWGYVLNAGATDAADTVQDTPKIDTKPNVFVVMPDDADLEDIFYYGIRSAAHANGLLCERYEIQSGVIPAEIAEQIQARIASATVVVAELSSAHPHIYHQLGYAQGCNRPVVLLANQDATLAIDPDGYQCVRYERIKDVELGLMDILDALEV